MKRLSELPAEDALTARAQVLIRAVGPTPESEERRRRVRRSLDARAPSPRWVWRAALVLGLLGASAAAAAASGSAFSRVFGAQPRVDDPPSASPPRPSKSSKPPAATPSISSPAPAPESARASEPAPSLAPVPLSATPRGPVPRVPALSDVARVHEAAKALRHDADPERALQLLERGAPVTGPLAEEALALRIEASRARGDGRQAKLAAAYLAQYPNGRYRELAKLSLSSQKP